jgi:type I restriction enzyme, S subunit
MRQGWPEKTIGEVCQFRGGGTPSKAIDRYWRGDIPWVSPKDMKSEVVSDSIDHISQEAIDGSATSLIPRDSVLMVVRSGILARTVPIAITGRDLTINQDLKALCPKPSVDFRFLYHLLDSKMDFLLSMVSRGATVHRLMTDQIRSLAFGLPPLPEQHRIVAILDEAFDGIATAKANAEKNLQNARALFESHLQSVFTERGEGWKQKTLEEVASTFGRGKSRHRPRNAPHLYGGEYPFIQTGDIRNADHVITEYSQTYSEAGLAQSKLWPKGTICITIAANIAETAVLGFDACFPDSVIGVVANPEEADVDFIEYLLQSFKARIQSMGKGSAQANINMGTFEYERFPFPSVAEQKRFVTKLDTLRRDTQRLESLYQQKLTALDDLKKSLLHQAFSGEL